MIEPQDIVPGTAYACEFTVQTFVDDTGNLVDTRNLRPGEPVRNGRPGEYAGFGFIQKRDVNKQLFEIWDETNRRTWVVEWRNTRNIDTIEWVDPAVSND